MGHYTGQALAVTLGGVALPGIREVTIPEEHPAPDTTHAPDAHGTSIPGGITYHNGCTMLFVDQSGETSWKALPGGTVGALAVYPEGNVVGKRTITMTIVVTNRDRVMAYDNAVVFTVTFNATVYEEGAVAPVVESCLISGEPTPAVIATYQPEPVVVEGATVQGLWVQGLDTDGDYAYISSFAYYDIAQDHNVIDRVPLTSGGEMLTGSLTRDLRYENADGWQGLVYNIRVHGDYVYAGGVNGLWILDKATLTLVGRCDYMELGWEDAPYINVLDVSADGNYVYVGGSGFGAAVIDVSNKAVPTAVWYDSYVDCEMLVLDEPYLYVVDDFWQFAVYDVTIPATPNKVLADNALFVGKSNTAAHSVANDIGAFAAAADEVSVLSVATPANATELARITITPADDYVAAVGASLAGMYLMVLVFDVGEGFMGQAKVLYYDISNPENPALFYTLNVGDPGNEDEEGWLRSFEDRYLLVSNNLNGTMAVIDSCLPN